MVGAAPTASTRDLAARLGACVLVGAAIWFAARPDGVTETGWHVLAVFCATIVSFLLRPLSMGPMVLISLLVLVVTGTLPFQTQTVRDDATGTVTLVREGLLAGYGKAVVWLVVAAFLIAGAVKRTGLGRRVALLLVARLGRSTRGLAYALCGSELLLGPIVPSNTARGGGIMAPIVGSLSRALGSTAMESPRRAGEYLVLVGAHANLITAAMFLTGMAANGLVAEAAADSLLDVEYGWGTWALGAIVPGLVGLALLPLLIERLARPELPDARAAQAVARQELQRLGAWSRGEKVMAAVFALLVVLWASESFHAIESYVVAWIGVCALLLTRTFRWKDACSDAGAWDALVWLGGLLSMATALKSEGIVAWFAESMRGRLAGFGGVMAAVLLAVIYFYSMYGFSMLTGHITALAGTFFAVACAAQAPGLLVVPLIAAFSNLCGCTTNYSTGPVVIYFGMGYVPAGRWFRVGFLVSLFHMAVWLGPGMLWWKLLGWW